MLYFIQNTKESIGLWMLNKRRKKLQRKATFQGYANAKTIGVIFNATQQDTYETARKYIKNLNHKNFKIKALGFVDSKEVLDFYQKSILFDYFSRKNLNWYGKPNNPNTHDFIESKFDILIDLSLVEDFPIQYIVGLSKAKFKVGCVKGQKNYYDLMINLENKHDLNYFIEQINHYLEMIQS